MEVITLSNQKGGVAKTTTCLALGAGLYQRGYTVLCIDLDPQCNLSLGSGADLINLNSTVYDVFKGNSTISDIITHISLGFDLAAGGLQLAGADMEFTSTGREYLLREALESVQDRYDYCIIDTPPTLGILVTNALTASNKVIIPLTADMFALQGLSQLNNLIKTVRKYSNPGLEVAGLLITKHDGRTNVGKALMNEIDSIADNIGVKVFKTCIRNSVAVRECQSRGGDIFREIPKANATQDYMSFIDEFLEGEKEHGKQETT